MKMKTAIPFVLQSILALSLASSGCGTEPQNLEVTSDALTYVGSGAYHGGSHGTANNETPATGQVLQNVQMWSGGYLDAFQFTYVNWDTGQFTSKGKHGGSGGYAYAQLNLNRGDYIDSTQGNSGNYIDQLCLKPHSSTQYTCSHTAGGGHWWGFDTPVAPQQIQGVFYAAGSYVDGLSFYYYNP